MERVNYSVKDKKEWQELRTKDVTSTEVSALFGISPYLTEFELWHRKKDNTYIEIEESERMKWGTRLEATIAEGIGQDNGWTVKPYKDYISVPELRIGSSFDYIANINGRAVLLEIKNVDSLVFKEGWIIDGDNLEAPPHIEMQAQHQMLVSGIDQVIIGALIGGNRVVLIHRSADQGIHKAILQKVAGFWKSIYENKMPTPDFVKDAKFISRLYGYAEPGKVLDVGDDPAYKDLIESYRVSSEAIKKLKLENDSIKARLLTMIGDAERTLGDGWTVSAGLVGEAKIEYIRKPYRNFRISFKKKKGA